VQHLKVIEPERPYRRSVRLEGELQAHIAADAAQPQALELEPGVLRRL
jgi:hypothetical protein